jgi:hypothetical protein
MDEDGFVGGEQRQPLVDPVGDVREQARVMTGPSPGSLDLLERRAHYGWVERRPRLAGERVGQPGRQQFGRDRNAVKCAQRSAKAFDHCLARVRVRRRPRFVHGSAWQTFGDVPRPVRAVAVGEVSGMRDLAAGEQVDDRSLVAIRVAKLSVVQPYDVFVADPHATNPAGLCNKAPSCWQTSGRQSPPQRRIGGQGESLRGGPTPSGPAIRPLPVGHEREPMRQQALIGVTPGRSGSDNAIFIAGDH